MKLLQEVLKDLKPNEKKVKREVDIVINAINRQLKKQGINAQAVAGGSIAKNTFLKDDCDCDIFVKFDYLYAFTDISKALESVLKKIYKGVKTLHGSRDYFTIKSKLNFEIIPVLNITSVESAQNITDCSPLHVDWVNKHQTMADEIRLAKAFAKAAGVYGAESYRQGFSGHVIDIVTIYYKGFLPLLRAAAKWKKKQVIDVSNFHKGKALKNLNESKLQSPLIVIDPIQPDRNAAAALGDECFEIFKEKAKEFEKKPSREFFTKKIPDINEIKKSNKDKKVIVFDAAPLDGKEDVVGSKLLKIYKFLQIEFERKGFKPESNWFFDKEKKCFMWFIFDKEPLDKTIVISGPPLEMKANVKDFKKKYKITFEKDGMIFAQTDRKYTLPEKLAKDLLKNKYIKERAKKIILK